MQRRTYKKASQINFETTMLKPSLCDYSDACIYFLKEQYQLHQTLKQHQTEEINK